MFTTSRDAEPVTRLEAGANFLLPPTGKAVNLRPADEAESLMLPSDGWRCLLRYFWMAPDCSANWLVCYWSDCALPSVIGRGQVACFILSCQNLVPSQLQPTMNGLPSSSSNPRYPQPPGTGASSSGTTCVHSFTLICRFNLAAIHLIQCVI